MDDFGIVIVILFVIAVLAPLIMIGIVVAIMIAAFFGISYLIVMVANEFSAAMERAQIEAEQQRLRNVEEELARAREAREEAERQERKRRELEEETQRQQRARERLEAERLRQAQEEAARHRLEAESDQAAQALAQWNNGLLGKRPSPEQISAIIEETSRMQSHCGKCLHVVALVGRTGVALEWKAHTGAACVPQVVGLRGKEEMFSEWAFAGRHTARLTPGRHALVFQVKQGGQSDHENDVAFEIFVPAEPPPRTADYFKKAVNTTAKEFVSRVKTVAKAKRKVNQILVAEGNDPDEIAVEMARLEGEIKDLH